MTRKEQIEKARELLACGVLSLAACDAIKRDFPELAESEDERKRKRVIECLKLSLKGAEDQNDAGCDRTRDIEALKWGIAFFEKQKEKPTNEEMLRTLRVEYEKGVADTIAKYEQEEQKPQYSPLCNTIKDKIHEYIANHFITDTVVKTDIKSIVKAMEEGVRLSKEEQKSDTRHTDDLQLFGFIYDLLNEIEWKDNWAMSKDECLQRLNNYRPQKSAEWTGYSGIVIDKTEYSELTDAEWAILRGFTRVTGLSHFPITIIKQTAQDFLAHLPIEWSDDDKNKPD